MQKLRNSDFLKIICYIAIPILVAIVLLCMVDLAYLKGIQIKNDETKYYQTQDFANKYLSYFISQVNICKNANQNNSYITLEDKTGNKYYYANTTYSDMKNYIYYIIMDKKTGEMYTNIKSNDYEQDIQHMNNHKIYWNYLEDGKIETNLEYINEKNIQYNYNYYYSKNTETEIYNNSFYTLSEPIQYDNYGYKTSAKLQDYNIYSFFDEDEANEEGLSKWNLISFIVENKNLPIWLCIISVILLFIIAIYLFWAIGHKEGKKITLGPIDKIPYEIIGILSFISITAIIKMIFNVRYYYFSNIIELCFCIILYFIGYAICAIFGITTIKRIKSNKFWESFLTYKIIKWTFNQIKQVFKEIKNKTQSNKQVFWYYWGFIAISVFLGIFYKIGITTILLIIFWIWVYSKIKKYSRQQNKIKDTLKDIYTGKSDIHIEEDELNGILKEMAIYINDISDGFSNSIKETLKSERLKTELITNVSHDIKTPLTSIINYVDLLKKENIQNERIREYIEIIDIKSQRLKKLTEDVVEASKVSSGSIELKIEEINIKELLNQTIGEFKDKLEEKNLKIEMKLPNSEIKINADSRYMYRIVENLFSNITKYALESSRVYIDVVSKNGQIEISIKNISKEKLNISSDELMQRFVRGDKSRYTQGSGLGLSIAKSLTELQNGKFDIIIDGDLFKVVMNWKCS